MFNPLICEKCGQDLESDDAISIIEGQCAKCRRAADSLCQPFRADQMIARAAAKKGRIPARDPAPYQESPILSESQIADSPAPEPIVEVKPLHQVLHLSRLQQQIPADAPLISPTRSPRSSSIRTVPAGHDLRPPAPPFDAQPTVTFRRRRRDLVAGVAVGLLLTVAIAGYLIRRQSESEQFVATQDPTGVRLALRVSPSSATVKLDGTNVGPADAHGHLTVLAEAGALADRWLEISAPGYQAIRQPLAMYRGAPEAFVELVREPYALTLATNPPEAEIWINGQRRGTTPANLTVAATGEATLEIRHPGYVALSKVLQPPKSGSSLELRLDLVKKGPVLSVETEPKLAAVKLDGKTVGTTPLNLQLDSAFLGKTVEIVTTAKGYDEARLTFTLPTDGDAPPVSARLILARSKPRIEVRTDPPGGRLVVAGQHYGRAPAVVEFDASQTGRTVVVEATLQDTHFGHRVLTVPPSDRPASFTIPMLSGTRRVVFILGWPTTHSEGGRAEPRRSDWAERRAMVDRLTSLIHQLTPSHRFSILAATEGGVEAWPGTREMEAGSNEQKVRAYDMIRAVRPTGPINLDDMLTESLTYKPTTIWVVTTGEIDLVALERFGNRPEIGDISLNVVRSSADADATWLDTWTAQHNGILTTLDRQMPAALAMEEQSN